MRKILDLALSLQGPGQETKIPKASQYGQKINPTVWGHHSGTRHCSKHWKFSSEPDEIPSKHTGDTKCQDGK